MKLRLREIYQPFEANKESPALTNLEAEGVLSPILTGLNGICGRSEDAFFVLETLNELGEWETIGYEEDSNGVG